MATDPYRLDFLMLEAPVSERRMEDALVGRITEFLQELGRGFAYMGRQHRLTVGERAFFLDLLFYNTHLHAYVVFEVKVEPFEPEQVGKLNLYVTVIERQLRRDGDGPTIGVLLVPDREHLVVEYALASVGNPIAVASYTYVQLPEDVQRELPAADGLARVVRADQPKTRRRTRPQ